jgi:hemoglobin
MQTVSKPTTNPGEPMRNRPHTTYVTALGVCLVVLTAACAKKDQQAAGDTMTASSTTAVADTGANRSLYDRLGGKPAITAVIDTFVARVAADSRINKKFAHSNIPRVKSELVDQVCAQTGGPCTYTGRTMKEAHRGMKVTEGEFNALGDDLVAALNAFKVPKKEQDELMGALSAMKGDIVEVQSKATGTALPASFKPAPALDTSSTKR